ncbi:hypothetical protein GCK32_011489 [Trichostrongylus colubriformis]|uniref:Integrase core domain protein n=1 Tax=Trichostrongylus colubriformis TaxID=6319 RepID=A0AAN8FII7_TRICO
MLLQELSNKIHSELEILRHIRSDDNRSQVKETESNSNNMQRRRDSDTIHRQHSDDQKTISCFYCDRKDHFPKNCPVFKTREDRLEVMRKRSLCRNCGAANHMASQCTRGPCRLCEKQGHHTSICPKTSPPNKKIGTTTATRKPKPRATEARRTKQNFLSTAAVPTEEQEPQEGSYETSLCMKNTEEGTKNFVLLGAAFAQNTARDSRERVHILLDTGADRSFISQGLAERLHLSTHETVRLRISTFGSQEPIEKQCGIANLQLWDPSGNAHCFSVTLIESIMEPLKHDKFTQDDLQFIADHGIQLSIPAHEQQAHPEVLLGCSDVFSLLQGGNQQIWHLPSGIKLIPSRIGYLVAGRLQDEVRETMKVVQAEENEENGNEREKWERFLAFESAGLKDFSGTQAQEQEQTDRAVWEAFEATITREHDGYHVRLPWADGATELPDNKSLAYKRLCSTLERLKGTPQVLEQYPAMGPLPAMRVVRAKPFENAGIDYFGPLTAREGDKTGKVYGLIITCMITRLVHIEIVMDMSTGKLLLALRRFFARRGVPSRITSDNGPSFILGEEILRQAIQTVTSDGCFLSNMAKKGIEWTTITPYAPWQGAVYERLIKSVKQSFYKTIGNRILTVDELVTIMTEVEGSLNSRPLTYQGELYDIKPLRPTDFIVKDMELAYPFENLREDDEDTPYLPSAEQIQLQTRRQAEAALASTQKLTERFWATWQKTYLDDLRESHKLRMDNKRTGTKPPRIGEVVLLADPNLPRYSWRMGRITELKEGSDAEIREAVVRMPNGNCMRRPVNLLVPLELEDNTIPSPDTCELTKERLSSPPREPDKDESPGKRYHLRKRQRINYNEVDEEEPSGSRRRSYGISTIQTCLLILVCLFSHAVAFKDGDANETSVIECIKGGIRILNEAEKFEVCSEEFCVLREKSEPNEIILFPPEIALHRHIVQWKTLEENRIKVIKIACPPAPFCEQVQCWFCTANVFNPECNTTSALVTVFAIVYLFTALIYTLCYVPLVIGKPCRLCSQIVIGAIKLALHITRMIYRAVRGRNQRQRRDIEALLRAPLIATFLILTVSSAIACQDVDIYTLKTRVCSKENMRKSQKCYVDTTNVVKLNTFNQEACLRITGNGTTLRQYRLTWKGLTMECEKETCRSWQETVALEVRIENNEGESQTKLFNLQPTVPTTQGSFRFTISSLSIPPTPALNAYFISNGEEIALWDEQRKVMVECDSREDAERLNCTVSHNCQCQPAELRVMCSCTDYNITAAFRNQLENRLPIRQPWGGFEVSEKHKNSVKARISRMVTAELLVTIKENIHLVMKETTNALCRIPNALATGCYNCKQGAVAELTCTSNTEHTKAIVRCEEYQFSTTCTEKGEKSEFRFSSTVARVKLRCTVSCGSTTTKFEVTGILNWVRTIRESVRRIAKGETTVKEEIVFPDFGHILDTIISSYKTVMLTVAGFVIAVVIGYIFLWACGLRIVISVLRFAFKLLLGTVIVPLQIANRIIKGVLRRRQRSCRNQNAHIKQL